jgi:hypothetical protein
VSLSILKLTFVIGFNVTNLWPGISAIFELIVFPLTDKLTVTALLFPNHRTLTMTLTFFHFTFVGTSIFVSDWTTTNNLTILEPTVISRNFNAIFFPNKQSTLKLIF